MIGRDKKFVGQIERKLKRTAPAQTQSSANQDDFQGCISDTTSSLSHSSEESDFEGILTSQKNDQQENKPSLVKMHAPKILWNVKKLPPQV